MPSAVFARSAAASVLTVCLTATGGALAQATPTDGTETAAGVVSAVSPYGDPVLKPTVGADAITVETAAGAVEIPVTSTEQLVFDATADGVPRVEVTLPHMPQASEAQIARDGAVVFEGGSTDIAVQVTASATRIHTVLNDPSAPTSYSYTFEGASPRLLEDGSVALVTAREGVEWQVGLIDAPWAYDAQGTGVATRYVVEADTLRQEVDHLAGDFAYPIVADPSYGVGLGAYMFFNRAETKTIATGGWAVTGATGVCAAAGALLGPAGAVTFGAACLAVGGNIVYQAGVANNSRKCVRLRWYSGMVTAASYKDKRCA